MFHIVFMACFLHHKHFSSPANQEPEVDHGDDDLSWHSKANAHLLNIGDFLPLSPLPYVNLLWIISDGGAHNSFAPDSQCVFLSLSAPSACFAKMFTTSALVTSRIGPSSTSLLSLPLSMSSSRICCRGLRLRVTCTY